MNSLTCSLKGCLKKQLTNLKGIRSEEHIKDQIRKLNWIVDPFFIIGIKGSLHLVDLFLKYFPATEKAILIASGLDEWELNWAARNLNFKGIVTIPNQLKHGSILDLIFSSRQSNFGIVDYDLFCRKPEYFTKLRQVEQDSMGNVLFMHEDMELGLLIAQTHAMYFNTDVIRKLIKKYNVKCASVKYEKLSEKIQRSLSSIGVDGSHAPEEKFNKSYFDTTRVLSLIGIAEGFNFNWIDNSSVNDWEERGLFHVGGVSDPSVINNRWRVRGSYFWQLALTYHPDSELRGYYRQIFDNLPSIDLLKSTLQSDGFTGPWFFKSVDSVLSVFSH